MMDDCPLAVCLDFYSHPPGSPGMSGRTEVGGLIHQAKYQQDFQAVKDLANRVVRLVSRSPILERADAVAAVPGSEKQSGAGPLLETIVKALSEEMEIPRVEIWRIKSSDKPQKRVNSDEGDDPNANQLNTMIAAQSSGRVLVVDDLMRYGSSIHEASRALRQRGASEVMALILAKDLKGTAGYAFPKG